jgi:two-component system chemotaxis response regulator CheB
MVPAMLSRTPIAELALPRVDAVVIGTSAGGVAALGRLLPALPAEMPFPVVVVIHMPREGPNALVDIFAPLCAVAVCDAIDKQPVTGGTVWFAPTDYHLLIESTRTFSLSLEEPVNYSRPAIDPLFESAAEAYGAGLVGIVLTGASADGARGALAVRESGGVLVVEDPAGADSAAMPTAAIALARPDAIGSVVEIATMLRTAAVGRAR